MKLVFNMAFDGEPWPGPLGYGVTARDAVVDEDWVGPHGLLGHLETQLGLPTNHPTQTDRIIAVNQAVRDMPDAFFYPSSEKDPIAVARTLLHWRDYLVEHGWTPKGRARKGRIAELERVTRGAWDGLPDRILRVLGDLSPGRCDIESIMLMDEPMTELPTLWRRLLTALEEQGVRVKKSRVGATGQLPACDLGRAFDTGFQPQRDGSLQLLRPSGVLQAAELVAEWLADQPDRDGTVILGADRVLDAALARRGLPTVGASSSSDGDPLLQLLPLVLAMGWAPPDPAVALSLVLHPLSPLGDDLSGALADALSEWPAVGSAEWEAAATACFASARSAEARERLEEWMGLIFTPATDTNQYPAAAAEARARRLERWARGRSRSSEEPERFEGLVLQLTSFRRLLAEAGLEAASEPQLQGLVSLATELAGGGINAEHQAGYARIDRVAQLAGPARRIVWWSFQLSRAERPHTLPLTRAERDTLERQGAELPSLEVQARRYRERWSAPFRLAEQALLLVCPLVDEAGESSFPHPIWDEIIAPLSDEDRQKLVVTAPLGVAPQRPLEPLPLPASAERWELPGGSDVRPASLSVSSLEGLIACPLKVVLERVAKLQAASPVDLQSDTWLYGNLAHQVLQEILKPSEIEALPRPADAARRAERYLDRELPRLAGSLLLPGADSERAEVRRAIIDAARALVRALRGADAQVEGVEQSLEREWLGRPLRGRADLLLSVPNAVIDHKWWGRTSFEKKLGAGAATQLAAYAFLRGASKGEEPRIAFHFVKNGLLQTASKAAFPGADAVEGPGPRDTWQAVERTVEPELDSYASGRVRCGGTPEDPDDLPSKPSRDEEGRISLPPPCDSCDFSDLCAKEAAR